MERVVIKHNRTGFTLIELLLTIVLFGSIASALYGGLIASLQLHARTVELQDLNRTIIRLANSLDSDFMSIVRDDSSQILTDSGILKFKSLIVVKGDAKNNILCEATINYTVDYSPEGNSRVNRQITYGNRSDSTIFPLPCEYGCAFSLNEDTFHNVCLGFRISRLIGGNEGQEIIFDKRVLLN